MKTPLFDSIDNLSIGEFFFLFLIFVSFFFAFFALIKTVISNKEEIKSLKKLQNKN